MKTLEDIKNELKTVYQLDTDKEPSYMENYEEFFADRRTQELNFLEIGIFKGGSLALWAEYFPQGNIYGLEANETISPEFDAYMQKNPDADIHPVLNHPVPPHTESEEKCQAFFAECFGGTLFDIILDDGAHTYTHSKSAFDTLFFHYLKPGGIYILEDWGTTYFPHWQDGSTSGEEGMLKMVNELCHEVALIDRMKGLGCEDLDKVSPMIHSFTVRFGQIWIMKNHA